MDTPVGISLALASAAGWAVGSVLYKRIGERLSAYGLNLASSALGCVLMLAVAGLPAPASIDGASLLWLVASGTVGIALGDTLFFLALQDLGAHALAVLACLAPVLTVALAVVVLGESPGPGAWVGIGLVLVGVAGVTLAKVQGGGTRTTRRGLWFGLGAVVAMAVGTVLTKRALGSVSAADATIVRLGASALGLALAGLATGRLRSAVAPLSDLRLLAGLLAAVATITLGGFWALHAALQRIDLAVAGAVAATEPILVLPLAAWWLRERVALAGVIGTLFAVAGVAVLYVG